MKSNWIKGLLFTSMVMIGMMFTSCGYERIDAGCEGIRVDLYGDDKGVGDVALVTGVIWYNPFFTNIFEYPAYVLTVDYPEFTVNSKDGSKFIIDPSILIKMKDGKAPVIFKKYRKPLEDVVNTSLYVFIKDAARIEFNKYNADEIISKREEVDKSFEDRIRRAFEQEHFILDQLTPGINYPKSYEDAIDSKNRAIQERMQIENEVLVAEAQAKKRLVEAEAEKKANELKTIALTPAILEKMWIEKWDGKLPIYGQVPTLFKDINK